MPAMAAGRGARLAAPRRRRGFARAPRLGTRPRLGDIRRLPLLLGHQGGPLRRRARRRRGASAVSLLRTRRGRLSAARSDRPGVRRARGRRAPLAHRAADLALLGRGGRAAAPEPPPAAARRRLGDGRDGVLDRGHVGLRGDFALRRQRGGAAALLRVDRRRGASDRGRGLEPVRSGVDARRRRADQGRGNRGRDPDRPRRRRARRLRKQAGPSAPLGLAGASAGRRRLGVVSLPAAFRASPRDSAATAGSSRSTSSTSARCSRAFRSPSRRGRTGSPGFCRFCCSSRPALPPAVSCLRSPSAPGFSPFSSSTTCTTGRIPRSGSAGPRRGSLSRRSRPSSSRRGSRRSSRTAGGEGARRADTASAPALSAAP